jgi:hypothetical protein
MTMMTMMTTTMMTMMTTTMMTTMLLLICRSFYFSFPFRLRCLQNILAVALFSTHRLQRKQSSHRCPCRLDNP